MKKRGISSIMITALLILITIAAIIIISISIMFFAREDLETSRIEAALFNEAVNIIDVDVSGTTLSLLLERGATRLQEIEGTTTVLVGNSDVISVVDLSQSMTDCANLPSGIRTDRGKLCCHIETASIWPPTGDPFCKGNQAACSMCGGTWVYGISAAVDGNNLLAENLLLNVNGNNLGVVGFGSRTNDLTHFHSLSDEISSLKWKIDHLNFPEGYQPPEYQGQATIGGETCICCGINRAIREFPEDSGDRNKIMIVMTDGAPTNSCPEQNTGNVGEDTIEAVRDAFEDNNIIVHVIGFGSQVNPSFLQQVATAGGGQYYEAEVGEELLNRYEEISIDIGNRLVAVSVLMLRFVVSNGVESETIDLNAPSEPYQRRRYELDTTIANVNRIEVYPVVITSSGEEYIGRLLDRWEIGS